MYICSHSTENHQLDHDGYSISFKFSKIAMLLHSALHNKMILERGTHEQQEIHLINENSKLDLMESVLE